MGKLFGTDGIRGIANRELTPELAYRIGRIGATVLAGQGSSVPELLVARDTRLSGEMLEGALVAGLASVGAKVHLAGVISTPAAAYLTRQLGACGGVMISASHNPFEDNGIKFFNRDGFKLSDETEEEMERLFFSGEDQLPRPVGEFVGRTAKLDAETRYLDFLRSTVPVRLDGLNIVLDCANGAVYRLAPEIFTSLGARVTAINTSPDGTNINRNCGSTHPGEIARAVRETGADVGFTFDGDADRVLAVDSSGSLVDGDAIMAVLAVYLREKNRLKNDTLVATVMSNMGLEKAVEQKGIKVRRTKVGDRYVLEEMLAGGYNLGGEQSGHIIMLDLNTTGDGLLTALQLASIMVQKGRSLTELASLFVRYPQVLVNCRVAKKDGLADNPRIREATERVEQKLAGRGRVLIRPSGTEPLVRVMLEGPNEEELHNMASELAEIIREELA